LASYADIISRGLWLYPPVDLSSWQASYNYSLSSRSSRICLTIFSRPSSEAMKSSGDVIGSSRLAIVCADYRICCRISCASSRSYSDIHGVSLDALFEEVIHVLPVTNNIDRSLQELEELLLDPDKS
jgi:hypothetical protein